MAFWPPEYHHAEIPPFTCRRSARTDRHRIEISQTGSTRAVTVRPVGTDRIHKRWRDYLRRAQIRPGQVRANELGEPQRRIRKVSLDERRALESRQDERRAVESSAVQHRALEHGLLQMGVSEIGPAQVRAGEVRLHQQATAK